MGKNNNPVKVGDKFTMKNGIVLEVVEYKSSVEVTVRDEAGATKVTSSGRLRKGDIAWVSGGRYIKGTIHPTKAWGDVKILSKRSRSDLTVQFLNTGNIRTGISVTAVMYGHVTDEKARKAAKSEFQGHYVYIARHNGRVVYVGKGSNDRYKHCNNGKSTSYFLNKLHFAGEEVTVEIVVDKLKPCTAAALEKVLITKYKPEGNIQFNVAQEQQG